MLLKISKNIILVVLFAAIAVFLLWVSIANGAQLQLGSNYALIHVENTLSFLISIAPLLLLCLFSVYTVYQINKLLRIVESGLMPVALFSALGLSSSLVGSISVMEALSALLALVSLLVTLRIHNQNSVLGLVFLNSIIIAVASVFFYPTLLVLLTAVLTIAFFRPFELRNYLVILTGASIVGFYVFSIVYLLPSETLFRFELSGIQLDFSQFGFNPLQILFSAIALLSIAVVFANRAKFIVSQRNQLIVISIYLALSVFLSIFFNSSAFWLGIGPLLSIFMLYAYSIAKRKWLYDVGMLLFIAVVLWLKL